MSFSAPSEPRELPVRPRPHMFGPKTGETTRFLLIFDEFLLIFDEFPMVLN